MSRTASLAAARVGSARSNGSARTTKSSPKSASRWSIGTAARRWLTAAMLFVAASLAVAYIANAIAVNNLVDAIGSLERERDAVRSDNERLRGELLRMMSVERVTAQASKQLGLISPQRPPVALGPLGTSTKSSRRNVGTTGAEASTPAVSD